MVVQSLQVAANIGKRMGVPMDKVDAMIDRMKTRYPDKEK